MKNIQRSLGVFGADGWRGGAREARRVAGLALLMGLLGLTGLAGPGATPATAADDYTLQLRMLGTGAAVGGDVAQFQQRHGIPENFSGGVDLFRFETEVGEETLLELDGRALLDNHDYLLRLRLDNEDRGFLDIGYREYRTWYDGRGGYFPPADASFTVFDPELAIDRGEAWARGGLVLPEDTRLTLGYRYAFREGAKGSVAWGDTTFSEPAPGTRRAIVPAFWEIDENRHFFDVGLERQMADTSLGSAFHYETTSLDNRRYEVRSAGVPTAERAVTTRDNTKSDVWGTRVFGVHRIVDGKVTLSGAYAYNDIDLDLAGSRIYGSMFNAGYSPTYANRQMRDAGFFDLRGTGEMREHVGNLAVAATPVEDLRVLASLRLRDEDRRARAWFVGTDVGSGPGLVATQEDLATSGQAEDTSWAEDLEVRYSGIDRVVLYARGQWEQDDGHVYESEVRPLMAPVVAFERLTDLDRTKQKYSAGTRVYPVRWLNLSTEYSYSETDYDYDHVVDTTSNAPGSSNRYPAFLESQEFATHDLGLRASVRLPQDVRLVARYDWLQSTIDTRGALLREAESAETRSHMVGATLTWSPANWWWTRGGFHYVRSAVDTATNNYDTPVADFLRTFDNDYWTLNLASGMALDEDTDAEFLYVYTSADNYTDLSSSTVSYGSRFDEHGVHARVARRLDEHTRVAFGYGYFTNDEGFAGGDYDYDVHLLTTSVEFEY